MIADLCVLPSPPPSQQPPFFTNSCLYRRIHTGEPSPTPPHSRENQSHHNKINKIKYTRLCSSPLFIWKLFNRSELVGNKYFSGSLLSSILLPRRGLSHPSGVVPTFCSTARTLSLSSFNILKSLCWDVGCFQLSFNVFLLSQKLSHENFLWFLQVFSCLPFLFHIYQSQQRQEDEWQ